MEIIKITMDEDLGDVFRLQNADCGCVWEYTVVNSFLVGMKLVEPGPECGHTEND